jgi:hypothetical protein
VSTPPIIRLLLQWRAPYFVRVLYQALLEREAEDHGLTIYGAELRRSGDLLGVTRAIAQSEEARRRVMCARPELFVTEAFRGLLGRDPEPEALTRYSENLSGTRDVAALLDDIGQSDEHWQRLIHAHADDLVRSIFTALLKREPDPDAEAAYSESLRLSADISALISTVTDSAEYQDLMLQHGAHSGNKLRSDHLPALLAEVVASPVVWAELAARRFPQPASAYHAYDQQAWVFVHIPKTGGTSLQNMLADAFGDGNVYREHGDTLYRRSPAELAQYSLFAGHFDYFSVAYIPRRARRLFTFLREPRQRLLSHYRFFRAHQPRSPAFTGRMAIANLLDAVEFFQSVLAQSDSDLWNQLTWCVMGRHKWSEYRKDLVALEGDDLKNRLDSIRLEVRNRLREFAFIGLQEDYTHSCQRLFELIGANVPHVRHDHSVELLSLDANYFKHVPRYALTPLLQQALAPLVQLDDIVYQEGCDLYTQRWGRIADVDGYRSI